MSLLQDIRELRAFNHWANTRILESTGALPEADFVRELGSSFSSIRDTLVHILSAEWVWLERLEGRSPGAMPEGWKEFSLEELRKAWGVAASRLEEFVQNLSEDELDRVVSYRLLSGQAAESKTAQILRHVVNHSTYHRGQVVTMLRQLGASAPATDLIVYYRAVSSPAAAAGD
jgi:uncharacterized damage-inducible protein DinB